MYSICVLGSGNSHWLISKAATNQGIFLPIVLPDMHTYESGHYLIHTRAHRMIKAHSQWSAAISHSFHFSPPPGHLRHFPHPLSPTHPCDFHSASFLSLSSMLCCTSFSLHPYLLTPSLIFHSHSAALRLIHKQHHSLQQQKVGRKEEEGRWGRNGGRVAPTDLLTAACWGLPETSQSGGWEEGRVRRRERESEEGRLRGENPSASNYTLLHLHHSSFFHSATTTAIHSL